MSAYISAFSFFWFLFFCSVITARRDVLLDVLAFILFVCFAGLRFETGNDWLVYRDNYNALRETSDLVAVFTASFEPLYMAVAFFFAHVVNFQIFSFFVSLFNGVILFKFCQFLQVSFSGVAAICFSWVYLATYMAATRYSIAISFILLSLIYIYKGALARGLVFSILAGGFHIFAIIFLPFLLLARTPLSMRIAVIFLLLATVLGSMFQAVYQLGAFSWIPYSEKLSFYVETTEYSKLSIGSILYIGLNLILFCFLFLERQETQLLKLAKWSTLVLLTFQIAMWFLPVFWNRVQFLVVIVQASYLSNVLIQRRLVSVWLLVMGLSMAVLYKFLSDPALISYIPYQNVVTEMLSNSPGDGEARFYESLQINQDRNMK